MELLRTPQDLGALERWRRRDPLVLVPTMGALHEGHLSLVRRGRERGPVVVSIFVNPTQFGPGEDFAAYPRTLDRDLQLLAELEPVAVFVPEVDQMYGPPGEVAVRAGRRADGLCGADRPGHFDGVLTVVAKLLHLIRPGVAVFGRKDAQQCLVIQQMVDDLKMAVSLIDVPTLREADGLAMSSRNRYLDAQERRRALCLYAALQTGREALRQGQRDPAAIEAAMNGALAPADEVHYAVLRAVPELTILDRAAGRILLAVAARVGPARLIDNFVLDVRDGGVDEAALLS